MKTTDPPIIVKQLLPASKKTVWKAITVLEEMNKWYFEQLEQFSTEVGFQTTFKVYHTPRVFTHLWEITDVSVCEFITYKWSYEEYAGLACVTFQLEEKDDNTMLTLAMKVEEDFPSNIPELKRQSGFDGWKYFIQQRLKNYLS